MKYIFYCKILKYIFFYYIFVYIFNLVIFLKGRGHGMPKINSVGWYTYHQTQQHCCAICTEWSRRTGRARIGAGRRQRLLRAEPARASTKMYRCGNMPFRTVTALIYRRFTPIYNSPFQKWRDKEKRYSPIPSPICNYF